MGEVTDDSDLPLRARPFKYFETKLPASLIAFTMLLKEFSPESEIEPPNYPASSSHIQSIWFNWIPSTYVNKSAWYDKKNMWWLCILQILVSSTDFGGNFIPHDHHYQGGVLCNRLRRSFFTYERLHDLGFLCRFAKPQPKPAVNRLNRSKKSWKGVNLSKTKRIRVHITGPTMAPYNSHRWIL